MAFRRLVRGQVDWAPLEAAARELVRRNGERRVRVTFLPADNWLSVPCVVDDRYFLKVVTPAHSLLHGLLTTGRNLGALSSGTQGFFRRFDDPVAMAEHELEATRRMREIGVNAPEPLEAFEVEGCGVLVLEYLPEFRPLSALGEGAGAYAGDLFAALARMHDANLAHGDLRAENVLLCDGDLYFIDATKVDEGGLEDARAYDLACALAVLEPLIGARAAVAAAREHYPDDVLLAAREFLDFVALRPDHDFDPGAVKGEVETVVDG